MFFKDNGDGTANIAGGFVFSGNGITSLSVSLAPEGYSFTTLPDYSKIIFCQNKYTGVASAKLTVENGKLIINKYDDWDWIDG